MRWKKEPITYQAVQEKRGKRDLHTLGEDRGAERYTKGLFPIGIHLLVLLKDSSFQDASVISEQIVFSGKYTGRAWLGFYTSQSWCISSNNFLGFPFLAQRTSYLNFTCSILAEEWKYPALLPSSPRYWQPTGAPKQWNPMAPPLQGTRRRQRWISSSFWTRHSLSLNLTLYMWILCNSHLVLTTWFRKSRKSYYEGEGTFSSARNGVLEGLSPFCHRCPVCLWHWGLSVSSFPPSTTHHTSYSCEGDKCTSERLGALWEDKEPLDSLQPKSVHIYQSNYAEAEEGAQKLGGSCPLENKKQTTLIVLKAPNSIFLGMNMNFSLKIEIVINKKYENSIYMPCTAFAKYFHFYRVFWHS